MRFFGWFTVAIGGFNVGVGAALLLFEGSLQGVINLAIGFVAIWAGGMLLAATSTPSRR